MYSMSPKQMQSGVMLLEALVGILIFSIGILALVGLQATAVKNQSDAKYRADASYLANQIIGQMWLDRTNFASYSHYPNPAVTPANPPSCNPGGAASANPNVTAWTTRVSNALPGATAARQQIIINTANNNQVTVVVCWKRIQDASYHNYMATTYIN
ncbi:MAG TPA: type IV pilus modification protein PilV [Burkholderiales bacterium]|nr:type IV pilus modification protein PilV [Burkholderiales bacterium]